MAEPIRLQKYFTDCGICSRRAAETEIAAGKVKVNGVTALVGDKIDPDTDVVEYRGQRVLPHSGNHLYLMLNKPRGYVTTAHDEKGRKTVTDLVRAPSRVYPVGRLDMDSDGLLLLTDDGEFANRLTHPRHEIPKIYHVTFRAPVTDEEVRALASPMTVDGYDLQPVGVKRLGGAELELTLYEGRNRQIRKMCEAVGLRVATLTRVAIGKLTLGDLQTGKWRELTADEVAYLTPPENGQRKEHHHAGSTADSK